MGQNVARSSLGWFFVHAPGLDQSLVLVNRSDSGFVYKRLQAVSDGQSQLLAIADSLGDITAPYAGSGYDQAAWKGAGLTSRAQTFDPRKWETNSDWGGIQQFRNRAYDPASRTWIQEDPVGASAGTNLYSYNNLNPVFFSDPLGLQEDSTKNVGKKSTPQDTCKALIREFSVGLSGIAGLGLIGSPFVGGGVPRRQ